MSGSRGTRRRVIACLICLIMGLEMALIGLSEALWTSEGEKVRQLGSLIVDYSHASQGYVLVKTKVNKHKMKLRVLKDKVKYDYDIEGNGEYIAIPLQLGSGKYAVNLYKRVSGKQYTRDAEISFEAKLESEYVPFLYPSQYVNYTADSPAVAASYEICEGLTTDREKLEAITDYMRRGFVYDYVRSLTNNNQKTYLGDIDGCFSTRMGLCQDLAAVAACMLRVQGIPTQLVIGYAGKTYHAWNNVLIDGEYQLLDITAELSHMKKDTVYTTERIY